MSRDPIDVSPDRLRLTVDGQVFDVAYDPEQPGAYHYSWVSGPNYGYGFTSRRLDDQKRTVEEHEQRIRAFLTAVDPETGYVEVDEL